MTSIPIAAVKALKSFNPHAKAFYLHEDGRFGAKYDKDSFQWVRIQVPFGFVDAGMSLSIEGAQRVINVDIN
nr:hypothetical protein [Pseudomonas aeruginosa]